MKVDLNRLDYRHTKELILWCIANDIDKKRASELYFAWYETPPHTKEYVWELDIPEEHLTYFMLKWK